ncbi:hypothetical protein FGO68_gene16632 [Halteria grandinella]|uniref:Uncharacterized protein n=1 Tax=Halteria grandinella TaxID=5974 RepID=A0A8J8SZ06_HALGN|nr:hypothetical protein FGO68_gene16632 [Halteria grandinella]
MLLSPPVLRWQQASIASLGCIQGAHNAVALSKVSVLNVVKQIIKIPQFSTVSQLNKWEEKWVFRGYHLTLLLKFFILFILNSMLLFPFRVFVIDVFSFNQVDYCFRRARPTESESPLSARPSPSQF